MWTKKVLVPFWVIEMIFLLITLVLGILALVVVQEYKNDFDNDDGDNDGNFDHRDATLLSIGGALVVVFSAVPLIFDITIIILYARQKLTPITYLVLSVIKCAVWTYAFVAAILAIAGYRGAGTGVGSIFLTIVLFATTLGQVIYGSVIMHRKRKGTLDRGTYAPAVVAPSAYPTYENYRAPSPSNGVPYAPYSAQEVRSPFRDPSRDPSPQPVPSLSVTSHHRDGSAGEYYNDPHHPHTYEMQGGRQQV